MEQKQKVPRKKVGCRDYVRPQGVLRLLVGKHYSKAENNRYRAVVVGMAGGVSMLKHMDPCQSYLRAEDGTSAAEMMARSFLCQSHLGRIS